MPPAVTAIKCATCNNLETSKLPSRDAADGTTQHTALQTARRKTGQLTRKLVASYKTAIRKCEDDMLHEGRLEHLLHGIQKPILIVKS